MRVIGYGSRTTNAAEQNYIPAKLEFLALKWAITDVFRDYLAYADHFTAYTDNNPLVYLMETQKLNAYCQRWISELAEFNFNIKYRPGVINRDADCLSRIPLDIDNYMKACTEDVADDAFRAIVTSIEAKTSQTETWRLQMAALRVTADDEDLNDVKMNKEKLKEEQRKDADISAIIECIETEGDRRVKPDDSSGMKTMKRCLKKLKMEDGLLMKGNRIVLPQSMREVIYEQLHVQLGHLGSDRVYDLAKQRVYWPRMQEDINEFIHKKCPCLMQKKPRIMNKAPLQSIVTTAPLELVTVDFIQLEEGLGGKKYILVIVDHFTRYAQAYATTNKSALTAAKFMYSDFILRFGIPSRFLSDQGGEFENKLMKELNKLSGIIKSRTTPYHPQTNGMCERMNQTLLGMLRTLPESNKKRWPEMVNKMIHAYNSTKHSVTGYSPFYLLFGRNPRLPIDTMLGIVPEISRKSHRKFLAEWKRQMSEAYRIASERTATRKLADQNRWNERPLLSKLIVGDRVLVLNKTKDVDRTDKGVRRKLKSFWEQKIYVVTSIVGDQGVVYEVKDESSKTAKPRILHRNMLLPVSDDFVMDPVSRTRIVAEGKKTKGKMKTVNLDPVVTGGSNPVVPVFPNESSSDESSSDDDNFYVLPTPVDGTVEGGNNTDEEKNQHQDGADAVGSVDRSNVTQGVNNTEAEAFTYTNLEDEGVESNDNRAGSSVHVNLENDGMTLSDNTTVNNEAEVSDGTNLEDDGVESNENGVEAFVTLSDNTTVSNETEVSDRTNLEDDVVGLSDVNDITDVESLTSSNPSVGEESDSVTTDEVESDRELPRALRDLADHNKRGLKEHPAPVKRQPVRRLYSEEVMYSETDSMYSAESERSMNLTPGTRARKQKCMRRKEYSERLRRSRGDGVNRLRSLDVEEEVEAESPIVSASDVVDGVTETNEFARDVDEVPAEVNNPGSIDSELIDDTRVHIEETNERSMAPNEGASESENRQRSSRSRRPPQKFEYDELGMPSVNVVHTIPTVKSNYQRQYYDKQIHQSRNNLNVPQYQQGLKQNEQHLQTMSYSNYHNNNLNNQYLHQSNNINFNDQNVQQGHNNNVNYQYIPQNNSQHQACENMNLHQANQNQISNTNQYSFDERSTFCCCNNIRSMWPENLIEHLTRELMFRRYGIVC